MKIGLLLVSALLLHGCTAVKYNLPAAPTQQVSYPEIGKEVTAFIGDSLVKQGVISEDNVLVVTSHIDGFNYDIPANNYTQVGQDTKQKFFSATGVIQGALSDPFEALSVLDSNPSEVCVITIYGGSSCYKGNFQIKKVISKRGNSFQQTLIYSGRVGSKINISYREFSSNLARPAFNNDVEYDLNISKKIGYKGAQIQVISADNSTIKYKLLKNFN